MQELSNIAKMYADLAGNRENVANNGLAHGFATNSCSSNQASRRFLSVVRYARNHSCLPPFVNKTFFASDNMHQLPQPKKNKISRLQNNFCFSFSSIPGSQQGADQDTGARARVPALDARGELRHTVIHIRPMK